MNIQERIEALETEFNERIKALKAEVQQSDEFPQVGDLYWLVDDEGVAYCTVYEDHHLDKHRQSIGNFFQTREQAEFASEKLKVEVELRKYSKPFKEDDDNCFIQINSSHNNIVVDNDECYQTQGTIYFKNRFEALDAIESVGENRIKKYIFGVED